MNDYNITGRDDCVVNQALYYAIKYIDGLPEEFWEKSNRRDMMKLLLARDPDYLAREKSANLVAAEMCHEKPSSWGWDDEATNRAWEAHRAVPAANPDEAA